MADSTQVTADSIQAFADERSGRYPMDERSRKYRMNEQAPLANGSRGMKLSAAGGRVLGRMGGHPQLILTTTGRRTGRPFSTPVIGITDGDDYLVVASNGGAATQPMWVRNIAANPRVTNAGAAPAPAAPAPGLEA